MSDTAGVREYAWVHGLEMDVAVVRQDVLFQARPEDVLLMTEWEGTTAASAVVATGGAAVAVAIEQGLDDAEGAAGPLPFPAPDDPAYAPEEHVARSLLEKAQRGDAEEPEAEGQHAAFSEGDDGMADVRLQWGWRPGLAELELDRAVSAEEIRKEEEENVSEIRELRAAAVAADAAQFY